MVTAIIIVINAACSAACHLLANDGHLKVLFAHRAGTLLTIKDSVLFEHTCACVEFKAVSWCTVVNYRGRDGACGGEW